jgi:uncharacterized protein YbaR (Trm112 family)
MSVDPRLLEILCCPVSKVPVVRLGKQQLAALNAAIAQGGVLNVSGHAVSEAFTEGLITQDGKVIYRVDDGIPVMLPDEGIGTTQFSDFPRL